MPSNYWIGWVKNEGSCWLSLYTYVYVCVRVHTCACTCMLHVLSHSVVSNSLWPHRLQPAWLFCPWGFSRQEYLSGLPSPSPGDLPNAEIEPRSLALQADWATREAQEYWSGFTYPFSKGSSSPRNPIGVSCTAGGFFTNWAPREATVNISAALKQDAVRLRLLIWRGFGSTLW